MITNVIESKHDGKPFWRIRSFVSFLRVVLLYKRCIGIGLTLNEQTGVFDMQILYRGVGRGVVSDIVKQFVEFDQASTRNIDSIDRRILKYGEDANG